MIDITLFLKYNNSRNVLTCDVCLKFLMSQKVERVSK